MHSVHLQISNLIASSLTGEETKEERERDQERRRRRWEAMAERLGRSVGIFLPPHTPTTPPTNQPEKQRSTTNRRSESEGERGWVDGGSNPGAKLAKECRSASDLYGGLGVAEIFALHKERASQRAVSLFFLGSLCAKRGATAVDFFF